MYYQKFEDLPVWNEAIDMALEVFQLSATGKLNGLGDLRNQIERSAISVSNNIAEGFERGTKNELLSFLYIARGSSGEVRSMLRLIERCPGLEDFQTRVDHLLGRVTTISNQLGGWIKKLKDSDHQGARSQNTQMKEKAQRAKRQEACLNKLKALVDETTRKNVSPGTGDIRDL